MASGNIAGGQGGSTWFGDPSGGTGFSCGSAIFPQGDATQTFSANSGQTQSITGSVADEADNGGTGSPTLVITGLGTGDLDAANSFAGGTNAGGYARAIAHRKNMIAIIAVIPWRTLQSKNPNPSGAFQHRDVWLSATHSLASRASKSGWKLINVQ